MKKLIITTLLLAASCTLTPQQRQAWHDFKLQAGAVATAVAPVAMLAGTYADIENARSIKRVSKAYAK